MYIHVRTCTYMYKHVHTFMYTNSDTLVLHSHCAYKQMCYISLFSFLQWLYATRICGESQYLITLPLWLAQIACMISWQICMTLRAKFHLLPQSKLIFIFDRCTRLPTLCFTEGGASWVGALFPFLSGVTEMFWKIETKFMNFRVLAGGFVMGCAKKSWF